MEKPDAVTERADDPRPINPYLVLASAILLPGTGHVLLGQATRGLVFLFFTLVPAFAGMRFMIQHWDDTQGCGSSAAAGGSGGA